MNPFIEYSEWRATCLLCPHFPPTAPSDLSWMLPTAGLAVTQRPDEPSTSQDRKRQVQGSAVAPMPASRIRFPAPGGRGATAAGRTAEQRHRLAGIVGWQQGPWRQR